MLSFVTPSHDEPFSLHNLGTSLPHTTFTGTGHWLHMDKPEEFNRILDRFPSANFLENAVRPKFAEDPGRSSLSRASV